MCRWQICSNGVTLLCQYEHTIAEECFQHHVEVTPWRIKVAVKAKEYRSTGEKDKVLTLCECLNIWGPLKDQFKPLLIVNSLLYIYIYIYIIFLMIFTIIRFLCLWILGGAKTENVFQPHCKNRWHFPKRFKTRWVTPCQCNRTHWLKIPRGPRGTGELEVLTPKTTAWPWIPPLTAEHLSFLPAAEKEGSQKCPPDALTAPQLQCVILKVSFTSMAQLPLLFRENVTRH